MKLYCWWLNSIKVTEIPDSSSSRKKKARYTGRDWKYLIILRLHEIDLALNGSPQLLSQSSVSTAIILILHTGKSDGFTLMPAYYGDLFCIVSNRALEICVI